MASLWMGDLEPYMTEDFIKQAFASLGENVLSVAIIRNRMTGALAGYCFVEFPDKDAADKCLLRVSGRAIPGTQYAKRFKLKHSLHSLAKLSEARNAEAQRQDNSSNINQQQVSDYVQAFSYYTQQFQQMLSDWKYDQKTGSYSFQQYGYTQSSWQAPDEIGDDALEDPTPAIDVNEANRQFMEQSEEFYDAIMDCHWQPLDSVTSKISSE
ncbi:tRNA selenocysteine 1-associated protein 1-like [Pelodytes ibericus]